MDPLTFRHPTANDLATAKRQLTALAILLALLVLAALPVVLTGALSIVGINARAMFRVLPSIPFGDLLLRCAFVTVACSLGKRIGKTAIDHGPVGIVLAFLIPLYNLFRPFQIVRALAATSATDDLAPVREIEERHGNYRQAARVERLVPPPAAPAPAVLAWQIATALAPITLFIQVGVLWTAVAGVAAVLQLLVFARLLQRFRARVGHLVALAAQPLEDA